MKRRLEDYDARMIFKENLTKIMEKRGITQKDIVELTGKNPSTVSDWVLGKKYPRIDVMQTLAKELKVTIAELTTLEGDDWQHRIASAYARSTIVKRTEACKDLGCNYIRIYDDRELVEIAREQHGRLKRSEITVDHACGIIEKEYRDSLERKWKGCTITVYHACIESLTTNDMSLLDEIRFDDDFDDDNNAMVTRRKIDEYERNRHFDELHRREAQDDLMKRIQ